MVVAYTNGLAGVQENRVMILHESYESRSLVCYEIKIGIGLYVGTHQPVLACDGLYPVTAR